MEFIELNGNIAEFALNKHFDVVVHWCNCSCDMSSGIAKKMAKAFDCDTFRLEECFKDHNEMEEPDVINKLGQIDYQLDYVNGKVTSWALDKEAKALVVVNAYTHLKAENNESITLDHTALELCSKKINLLFPGKTIGIAGTISEVRDKNSVIIIALVAQTLTNCTPVFIFP